MKNWIIFFVMFLIAGCGQKQITLCEYYETEEAKPEMVWFSTLHNDGVVLLFCPNPDCHLIVYYDGHLYNLQKKETANQADNQRLFEYNDPNTPLQFMKLSVIEKDPENYTFNVHLIRRDLHSGVSYQIRDSKKGLLRPEGFIRLSFKI
ncbi:hypothetical protein KKG22_01445 [Patescibacteria group bacterium]|nr:hypothetical protein [Patescibacteria group bacterium]MBU1721759.1 hypothetical protein [Patescibacteria group bacterium]MBU1901402.1 hypothetical protein [Patescibacteria group bacterium]